MISFGSVFFYYKQCVSRICWFHFVGNLFIGIVYFALHTHRIACLIACRPENNIRSLINKRKEAMNQMIDKTILIQIKAFFCCYIQNLRWLYVALCICCNKKLPDEQLVSGQLPDCFDKIVIGIDNWEVMIGILVCSCTLF